MRVMRKHLVLLGTLSALLALPAGPVCATAFAGGAHSAHATTAKRHGRTLGGRERRLRRRSRSARARERRVLAAYDLRATSKLLHELTASAQRAVSRHAAPQRSIAAEGGEACPGEDATPAAGNLEAIREATLCLVNEQRVERGERPLTFNARLERSAQGHTANMVVDDYFGHFGPDGRTPSARMREAGYIYSSRIGYEVGENIAWGTLYLATPKSIVQAWMQSPGHRENILDARYRETAIGVLAEVPAADAEGQPGATYTQDFGTIITG